ncbi:hypothetical protein [Algivirga pacifica]|uniref:Uncharacterized protein n=1 Tax=Algivirga pacifica TaxID=1162670 RepID=A0ABP9D8Q2_9BACT
MRTSMEYLIQQYSNFNLEILIQTPEIKVYQFSGENPESHFTDSQKWILERNRLIVTGDHCGHVYHFEGVKNVTLKDIAGLEVKDLFSAWESQPVHFLSLLQDDILMYRGIEHLESNGVVSFSDEEEVDLSLVEMWFKCIDALMEKYPLEFHEFELKAIAHISDDWRVYQILSDKRYKVVFGWNHDEWDFPTQQHYAAIKAAVNSHAALLI